MKLIPFLRFGGDRGEESGDDALDPLSELPELPTDEEVEQMEDEETKEEETEEEKDKEETQEDDKGPPGNDEEMLKMFMAVEEEMVDNSSLAAQIDDVPADELLQELRTIASAFGIRVAVPEDEAV
jgi:hypothetical protein